MVAPKRYLSSSMLLTDLNSLATREVAFRGVTSLHAGKIANVGLMSGQRHRRWANVEPTSGFLRSVCNISSSTRHPPVGKLCDVPANTRRSTNIALFWVSVEDGGPTVRQHWFNVSRLLGYQMISWYRQKTLNQCGVCCSILFCSQSKLNDSHDSHHLQLCSCTYL